LSDSFWGEQRGACKVGRKHVDYFMTSSTSMGSFLEGHAKFLQHKHFHLKKDMYTFRHTVFSTLERSVGGVICIE
jgi:hypothetical protein